ncbi:MULTISPECIES: PadR family transcriptional regulator [Sphingobium]|uniref:PadR family transcriptional regulator n=1 Tax=Sphingobium cupriresistens TaxID=1132417 RepID=A0A8G1ZI77_9SPHN|nr:MULTISPECIES: PadR family transcriptional regulator [Sphingobium]MBJ7377969.1 PadR family transcriptional regulator [Sphingobium sp.]RYM13541.1 PadR family transcriptional regulator [Sphingobium cupriresistens]
MMHFPHSHRGRHGGHYPGAGRFGSPDGFGRGGGRGGPFGGDPFGEDGLRGGGRGGGGGGRRRLFDNETLRLILLKLIADEPRHGYELIRAIEALSGEAYAPSPGVVYPTLTMLAEMDLIVEEPLLGSGSGSRKRFAITDAGKAQIEERKAALDLALARLAALAQRAERVDGAPVRRALHNLRIAIQHRLEKEGADNQTMFDVASLIDEAASKIERL